MFLFETRFTSLSNTGPPTGSKACRQSLCRGPWCPACAQADGSPQCPWARPVPSRCWGCGVRGRSWLQPREQGHIHSSVPGASLNSIIRSSGNLIGFEANYCLLPPAPRLAPLLVSDWALALLRHGGRGPHAPVPVSLSPCPHPCPRPHPCPLPQEEFLPLRKQGQML